MKKILNIVFILSLALATAFVTPWLMKHPGIISIEFAGYEIELKVLTAAFLILALIIALWLVVFIIRLPQKTKRKFTSNRSRKSFAKGLLALSEGKWKLAEKLLVRSAKNSPTPELSYMAAARAAVAQNNIKGAFEYLNEAEINTDNPLTVDLTRCELWIKTGDNEKAINLLKRILQSYPNNPRALHLMTQASQNAGQWQQLRDVLPKVQKLAVLPEDKAIQLTHHSISQQLNFAQNQEQLQATWDSLSKQQKQDLSYIHAYAENGLKLGMYDEVALMSEKLLSKNLSTPLLKVWGQLNLSNENKIKVAEKWLKKSPENAELLKILGKLCLDYKLWGKAQSYLQKSLELNPEPETYKLMAQYFEAVGETDNALQAYKQATGQSSQIALIDNNTIEQDE